jgi:hypothetical protein
MVQKKDAIMWRAEYKKPMKVRCSSAAFLSLHVQRSRKAGFSSYNVTPLPKKCCSTLFTTGYKRLVEGGHEAFGFWLLAF